MGENYIKGFVSKLQFQSFVGAEGSSLFSSILMHHISCWWEDFLSWKYFFLSYHSASSKLILNGDFGEKLFCSKISFFSMFLLVKLAMQFTIPLPLFMLDFRSKWIFLMIYFWGTYGTNIFPLFPPLFFTVVSQFFTIFLLFFLSPCLQKWHKIDLYRRMHFVPKIWPTNKIIGLQIVKYLQKTGLAKEKYQQPSFL